MHEEPITWTPSLETALQLVDQEHQTMVHQLNEMIALLQAGAPSTQWLPILDSMVTNVHAHFEHEEAVMENIGFPGLVAHQRQHQQLLQEIAVFRRDLDEASKANDTLTAIHFLKYWVLRHIVQEDIKLRRHVYKGVDDAL